MLHPKCLQKHGPKNLNAGPTLAKKTQTTTPFTTNTLTRVTFQIEKKKRNEYLIQNLVLMKCHG